MNDFAVAWDHENTRYVVATIEDMKNHNAGRALDRKPGVAIVRSDMTRSDADRYAKAMNESLRSAA